MLTEAHIFIDVNNIEAVNKLFDCFGTFIMCMNNSWNIAFH